MTWLAAVENTGRLVPLLRDGTERSRRRRGRPPSPLPIRRAPPCTTHRLSLPAHPSTSSNRSRRSGSSPKSVAGLISRSRSKSSEPGSWACPGAPSRPPRGSIRRPLAGGLSLVLPLSLGGGPGEPRRRHPEDPGHVDLSGWPVAPEVAWLLLLRLAGSRSSPRRCRVVRRCRSRCVGRGGLDSGGSRRGFRFGLIHRRSYLGCPGAPSPRGTSGGGGGHDPAPVVSASARVSISVAGLCGGWSCSGCCWRLPAPLRGFPPPSGLSGGPHCGCCSCPALRVCEGPRCARAHRWLPPLHGGAPAHRWEGGSGGRAP